MGTINTFMDDLLETLTTKCGVPASLINLHMKHHNENLEECPYKVGDFVSCRISSFEEKYRFEKKPVTKTKKMHNAWYCFIEGFPCPYVWYELTPCRNKEK